MRMTFMAFLLGLVMIPTQGIAMSENEHLSCVKELPNPNSLAARRDYVLTCITKTADLTITKVTVNQGKCECQAYRSTVGMKTKTRIMSICRSSANPCDFTEVAFETNAGSFAFTWAPDQDDLSIP
jgi:hypothetical protein